MSSRIGLGTAQFGTDYGITNRAGRIAPDEAAKILDVAQAAGIGLVDTARLYGDSERVLGGLAGRRFRIVTKTPKFAASADQDEAVRTLREAFEQSLESIGTASVYGLLLHDAGDAAGPHGPALWQEMKALRAAGHVEKIGISVYEGSQIDALLGPLRPDLVQLPVNPLDRRLIEGGQIARLASAQVEIHARSLFLQGLLLADPARVPEWLGPVRAGIADLHRRFAASGLSPIEGIFAWAFSLPIRHFICGVTSAGELEEVAIAAQNAQLRADGADLTGAPYIDPIYLNPARWPTLAGEVEPADRRT